MPDILLRTASESDSANIRDLIHRVGINPLNLDWKHFIIAEEMNNQFAGCGQLKQHKDGSFELASLAVEEKYRGLGVARAIIEHFLDHSPRPLYLMCRPGLAPLYEKFGFRIIGPDSMPPYFLRIRRLVQVLVFLTKHATPYVMRLD